MMESVSVIVDLSQKQSWDPGRLVATSFRWPVLWEQRILDDIGERLEPRVFVEHGTQVITPTGLDRVYGGVRKRTTKYRGTGYLVGGDSQNLQPGDVLIPTGAELPAVVVDDRLFGSTVSSGFWAFRFESTTDAYWAWGVINSTAGHRFRRAFQTSTMSSERPRIGSAVLPWPEEGNRDAASEVIADIEKKTHRDEDEGVETWWSTADLRRNTWRMALATPDPTMLMDGVPLDDLAFEIKAGRAFNRNSVLVAPTEGALPIVTGSVLAGRPVKWWLVDPPESTLAEPGDLLIAVVGARANAQINAHRVVIDSGVYRVRLSEQRYAKSITAFFNGQKGYGLRKMLLSGSIIPRIGRKDFGRTRIPGPVLEDRDVPGPVEPLSSQLERVLWKI